LKENNIFDYDERIVLKQRGPQPSGCVPIMTIDKTDSAETLKLEQSPPSASASATA